MSGRYAARPRFFVGWAVVGAALLASFSQVAFFNPVLGVFIPQFQHEFGWSRTEISLGVTFGSLVGAVFAPIFGPLVDRYGGRRFVVGSACFMSILLLLLSRMQTEWQFYLIYALGRGTGSGLMDLTTAVTVSKWFVRRRGVAIGVMSLGPRLGFALLPIGVQVLIDAANWRTAAVALSATVFVFGALPSLKFLHPRPEAMGLLPDGDEVLPHDETRPPPRREVSWTRRDAVRTPAFWLVTLAVSLMSLAGGAINLHQIPHLEDRGLSPDTAALVITVVAVFGGAGVLLEGYVDSKVGARWTMVVGLLGSAVGMVFLISVHGLGMALIFAVVYGLSFGIMVASNQVVFADYFGREAIGAIRGAAAPIQLCLNAVGPVLAGAAYDLTGGYSAAFIPFMVAYIIAAGALVIAKKPAPSESSVTPPSWEIAG